MAIKYFLFVCLILACTGHTKAQQADVAVDKYINFIGGAKNWKKVKTLTASGEYNYGGMKFPFSSYSKAPNLYKFVVPFEGKFYAQAFDGTKGWKIDAFKNETSPTELTGKPAQLMANEADVELEDPFIDYKVKGHRLTLEGTGIYEGKNCVKIKLTRKTGEIETYYFDEISGAMIVKVAPSKNAELQGSLLETVYSDYRDVGKIKIPFKTVSKSNDQTILEITIERAEVNVPIPTDEFQWKKN